MQRKGKDNLMIEIYTYITYKNVDGMSIKINDWSLIEIFEK